MNTKYNALFEPFTFKSGVTIDNRLIMAPMTTNSAFENGMVTTDEHNYYKRRAKGLGAVITACAQVREDGKFAGSLSAATDMHIESLSKLAQTIQSAGTKAILQLFHVGRMGSSSTLRGLQPVSASPIPSLRDGAETPRALRDEEIHDLVDSFGKATKRAIEAGFDGVEIHGANTYLIQQFFSPHSNRRDDHWGGTLEKRMNFPLAIVDEVKTVVEKHANKPFVLGYRISPEEIEEPGITFDDTLALLERINERDLDYIHISLGHYMQGSMRNPENKTPLLQTIVEKVGSDTPIIGVGSVHTPDNALEAMEALNIPLVALGRQLLVEPDWIEKVKTGKEATIRKEIHPDDREDLVFPDAMWEYIQSNPGWVPFAKSGH